MAFQIFLRTASGRTIIMDATPTITVGELKNYYRDKEGLPPELQRVIYASHQLDDDTASLGCVGVVAECTVHFLLCVHGTTPIIVGHRGVKRDV